MTDIARTLVSRLASAGIDTVFGIPGVHNLALYRALPDSGLRHVTARHEQGAGFMADGYARASGRPAACFVISGPGVTNIATAMGQALADSVPMLVIATTDHRRTLGLGQGRLHEVDDQFGIGAAVARHAFRLLDAEQIHELLDLCLAALDSGRPGPVYLEIPRDLLEATAPPPPAGRLPAIAPPAPDPAAIASLTARLARAARPVLVVGGGCADCGERVRRLAERCGAAVIATVNGKGLMPPEHALAVPGSPSLPVVRGLLAEADLTLAIGTELGETDLDFFMSGPPQFGAALARIDIDPLQLTRNARADIAIHSDASLALDALLSGMPDRSDLAATTAERVARVRDAVSHDRDPAWTVVLDVIAEVWREGIIAGDSTQPTYRAWLHHDAPAPRRYFHSASGFGTLGYGLPAAIGAACAGTGRPVLALIGDGGIQFTLAELMVAVQERLPVCVLVWDNAGYEEIHRFMVQADMTPVGVDARAPDFRTLAEAFDCALVTADSPPTLAAALREAFAAGAPVLLHADAAAILGSS